MLPLTLLREKSEFQNLGNGPKSPPWKSSCLEAAGDGDLRVCVMQDLEQWPCHPFSIQHQQILHWWFKSGLCLSEFWLDVDYQLDSSRYQGKDWGERLEKPEFYQAKNLCLNQLIAYSLLRCGEDSFLSATDSSEVGAGPPSPFPLTQN